MLTPLRGASLQVDTGASASQYEERMEYIRSNFKYKKGEIFKRIKVTTLAQLMVEVAEAMRDDMIDDADLDEAATFQGERGVNCTPPCTVPTASMAAHGRAVLLPP
jgi:hypothetical protein